MDFTITKRQIISTFIKAYGNDRESWEWSLAACLRFFMHYFAQYEQTFNRPHPRLSNASIRQILSNLECATERIPLNPDDYPPLIEKYFATEFQGCDHSLAHFMSGRIREILYYETLY